ncbi:hypothetical protein M422DRAFT_173118, partial [Sphaerobolus stellatus SS14]
PTIPINHYGNSRNQQNRTTCGSPRHPIKDIKAHHQGTLIHTFNYKLFNSNNFNIHYWSWNYCGCWHQICPSIVPH